MPPGPPAIRETDPGQSVQHGQRPSAGSRTPSPRSRDPTGLQRGHGKPNHSPVRPGLVALKQILEKVVPPGLCTSGRRWLRTAVLIGVLCQGTGRSLGITASGHPPQYPGRSELPPAATGIPRSHRCEKTRPRPCPSKPQSHTGSQKRSTLRAGWDSLAF